MDLRKEEDATKFKTDNQDEESQTAARPKHTLSVKRRERQQEDEQVKVEEDKEIEQEEDNDEELRRKQSMAGRSFIERASVDKHALVRQKLKGFTQAEVVAHDSDSAGDAYDADVDDVFDDGAKRSKSLPLTQETQVARVQTEREHIYELFQPWALKTYGDQAKTKTITLRKKARILKALEGKEHSRPDSSKFRFWVKSKAFSTKRPEGFTEVPGSQSKAKSFPPDAVLSDMPSEVDLFVASTSKDFGKRNYRKVAVVEEFFNIIYNVHMELGGRSGMHAGQKRTYRIITETYAFLPREAVTRFLSTCPECKKNLRPSSPSASTGHNEEPTNESSSEVEALNYSSHTESSIEAGPTGKCATVTTRTVKSTTTAKAKKRRHSQQVSVSFSQNTAQKQILTSFQPETSSGDVPLQGKRLEASLADSPSTSHAVQKNKNYKAPTGGPASFSVLTRPDPFKHAPGKDAEMLCNLKITTNPLLQRRRRLSSPTLMAPEPVATAASLPFNPLSLDFASLKTHDSLIRYYEFMRRFYGGKSRGFGSPPIASSPSLQAPVLEPVLAPPIYGSALLRSLPFPTMNVEKLRPEMNTLEKKRQREVDIKSIEDADEDACAAKKLKISSESSAEAKHSVVKIHSQQTDQTEQTQQILEQHQMSAINLSKSFHFSTASNGGVTVTSKSSNAPPASIKVEPSTHPALSSSAFVAVKCNTCQPTALPLGLRIPKISHPTAVAPSDLPSMVSLLPPLDMQRLKPITSTYLQLTRSMGLSDEDALRFDNLFAAARTITHHETITKSNGDKVHHTWTTDESDEEDFHRREPTLFQDVETFQSNSDTDELLKEAAQRKGMDPEAITELLQTKAPVVRTVVDPRTGYKHTTTYKLDPSGTAISSHTLVEMPTVRRVVTKITQPAMSSADPQYFYSVRPQDLTHPMFSKLPTRPHGSEDSPGSQAEWLADPNSPVWTMSPWHLEPTQQNVNATPNFDTTVDRSKSNVPQTWWQPSVSSRIDNSVPKHTMQPDEYVQMQTKPISDGRSFVLPKNMPAEDYGNANAAKFPQKNLDQMIADLYKTTTTTSKPTTIKTIRVEDLPVVEVLNNGEPVGEDYLRSLPSHLRPAEGNQYKPLKTLNISNIPLTTESVTPPVYGSKRTLANANPTNHVSTTHSQHHLYPQHFQYNAIADYLGKIGLTVDDVLSSNRRTLTKKITDADGNILTATFMLSSVTGGSQQSTSKI